MRAFSGTMALIGLFAAVSLILPLLEYQWAFFPDEWTYTTEHFIIGGILSGLGVIFGIILFSMKKPEAK